MNYKSLRGKNRQTFYSFGVGSVCLSKANSETIDENTALKFKISAGQK